MDGTGTLYQRQVDALATVFDIRCLAIPPDDCTDWSGLAEQAVALISDAQGNRPLYLCGESFGACLALQIVTRASQLADYLVLINSATAFHRQNWGSWASSITRWLPTSAYSLSTYGLWPLLAALHRIDAPERRSLLTAMQSVTHRSAAWRLSLLADEALAQLPLETIQQPVLLLAAAADRLLPSVPEAERLARRLPHAQLRVLPHSGHACLLERDINLFNILQKEQWLPALVGSSQRGCTVGAALHAVSPTPAALVNKWGKGSAPDGHGRMTTQLRPACLAW
ncbi:Putative aminoacrylate hydrolase RutD [Halomicronema hongdechloris C2206]|uniref:Aminoacrylate hydrolase RutD n=2 Tax=Halomicronema hongdechloris TaxID=1209493 RepID=A0A1Z3HFZ9_9CYAN|nr:Putative aminoacrylate hydrolase RutD [Halomicronema hongdechloris C2206]